ncbi:MAG TPA: M14 family zinc carboxypeptidase, partial [Prolixibacteraceae bacterium]|nr:M14 family zinc carboxypeptidase [Prolixibacteraceae bacterium]
MIRKSITTILFLALALAVFSQSKGKIEVPLRFDRYYDYDEMTEALKALHKAYPKLTRLDLVGRSEENREIWALTINNDSTGEALTKPGVYVDGN